MKIKAKDFIAIPNILSYIRIVLIFVFLYIYNQNIENKSIYLGIVLILSGVSDALDGFIARKFNMITEVGKCLDPIADKVTQLVLLICLIKKYSLAKVVLCIFLVKEIVVSLLGWRTIFVQGKNEGAKWYGKLSTVIFYVVTIILVIFVNINQMLANGLLMISGLAIMGAFVGYTTKYLLVLIKNKQQNKR